MTGSAELTVKPCGTPRGANHRRTGPDGMALLTDLNRDLPVEHIEQFILAVVHMAGHDGSCRIPSSKLSTLRRPRQQSLSNE
jgi:hypothetical protein